MREKEMRASGRERERERERVSSGSQTNLARVQRLLREAAAFLEQQRGVVRHGGVERLDALEQSGPQVGKQVVRDQVRQLLAHLRIPTAGVGATGV
jgi:hypothetical protein